MAIYCRLILFCLIISLCSCATTTRDMQEKTVIDVVIDTFAGAIRVHGTIDRTQHETTEITFKMPGLAGVIVGGGLGTILGGGMGATGLTAALVVMIKRRRDRERHQEEQRQKQVEHDKVLDEIIKKKEQHFREICKGIAKFLNNADKEDAATLKQHMREATSQDTRDAIRDYI